MKTISEKNYELHKEIAFKNIVIPDKRNEVESDQPALPDEAGNLFNGSENSFEINEFSLRCPVCPTGRLLCIHTQTIAAKE